MKHLFLRTLWLAVVLSLTGRAQAANRDWLGTTSSDWGTAANWSPAFVPGAGDTAIFNSPGPSGVVLDASRSLDAMTFGPGLSAPLSIGPFGGFNLQWSPVSRVTQNSAQAVRLNPSLACAPTLTLDGTGSGQVSFEGQILGAPDLVVQGPAVNGPVFHIGTSITPGGLTLNSITVQGGTLRIGNSNAVTVLGPVVIQSGGTLTLCNPGSFAGNVSAPSIQVSGTLFGNGALTASTAAGVTVSGGTSTSFNPGCSPGTLTVHGNLTFAPGVAVNYELATPGVVGGGVNDLTVVNGDLFLAGVLNVSALPGFGNGTYRLFNHTGARTGPGLVFGSMPPGHSYAIDTTTPGQVNLVVSAPPVLDIPVVIRPGYNLVSNPLQNTNNLINTVLPDFLDDGQVVLWNEALQQFEEPIVYYAGTGWVDPVTFEPSSATVPPGRGFVLVNPGAANFNLTFRGEPALPSLPAPVVRGGYVLLGRQVPGGGTFSEIVGRPPEAGCRFIRFSGASYITNTFDGTNWSGGMPSVTNAEAAFIYYPPLAPPAITQQPQSQAVVRGSNAALSVSAAGSPPLTFQWFRVAPTSAPPALISGATNSTYSIVSAQTNHEGGHFVVVTNASGSVTSSVAMLDVRIANLTSLRLVCADGRPLADCVVTLTYYDSGPATGSDTQTTDAGGYIEFVGNYGQCEDGYAYGDGHFVVTTACCPNQSWTIPTPCCCGDLGTLVCSNCPPPPCDPPQITCAPSFGVTCAQVWSFGTPTALDLCCGGNAAVTVLGTVTSGNCPRHVTRTWQATDCRGQISTCSQTVTVVDATPPAIRCPGPIQRTVCGSQVKVFFKATATDTCDPSVPVNCVPASGSFFGTGTTTVTCTATDDCGNTANCSFPVRVTDSTVVQYFPAGIWDSSCFGWPLEPATRGACLNASYPAAAWKPFDDLAFNRFFGHTWSLPAATYLEGKILSRLRDASCRGESQNDTVSLGLYNCNPASPGWRWTRHLGPSAGDPGLLPFPWCNVGSCGVTLAGSLGALPLAAGGTVNLLPDINASQRLDFFAQDDTAVDFLGLWLRRCPPTSTLGGFGLSLTNAELVRAPDAWCLTRNPGSTNFTAQLDLGAAPGVQFNFSAFSLASHTNGRVRVLVAYDDQVIEGLDGIPDIALTNHGDGTASWRLGRVAPGASDVTVQTFSNGVLTATDTQVAADDAELARFPAGASVASLGVLGSGQAYLQLDHGSNTLRFLAYHLDHGSNTPIRAVTLEVDGIGEFTLGQPEIVGGGQGNPFGTEPDNICELVTGHALARVEDGQFTLSALDATSPEPFGVQVLLAVPTNEIRAAFNAVFGQFSTAPSNASLRVSCCGSLSTNGEDGAITFQSLSNGLAWQMTSTLDGTNALFRRVEVWSNDVRVAVATNPVQVQVSELPRIYWPVTTWFVEADICHRFPYGQAVTVQIDGAVHQGHEVRVLWAEDDRHVTGMTQVSLEVVGAEALVLSSVETGPVQYQVAAPELDGTDLILRARSPGGVLESAPSPAGPWTILPVPAGGEVRVSITNAPARFFRARGN